jgi:L-asparaginase
VGRVTVLTTGGTIASRQSSAGGATAADDVAQLLAQIEVPAAVTVQGREILRVNSFAMTPADMRAVLAAVEETLADPEVDGVVVTHGTDTMEETALLVDLFLRDDRPVVFTGAQRAADQPEADGPANLRDAITVAAARQVRGVGVLLVFDGSVYPARGTRKTQTVALAAFSNPDRGPMGRLEHGQLRVSYRPVRSTVYTSSDLAGELPRVDIVAIYPGVDDVALVALARAGTRGIVLEATGVGNANPIVVQAVRELVAAGVVVLVSTRVDAGPVAAIYGGGGGVDLERAGAVLTEQFRPGQARILLTALLGIGASAEEISRAFDPQDDPG